MRRRTVPAVVASLEPLTGLLAELAAEAELGPPEAYRLRLAAEELFINIVRHGYGPDRPDGEVVVEGGVAPDGAWLRLIDTSPRFNPFEASDPSGLDRPLRDREPGALGLYLARHAVDAGSHEYVDGTNRTTVVVRRGRPDGDELIGDARDDTDRERG